MGLHAEFAVVERRGVGCDQFAKSCAEGTGLVHEGVRERSEVVCGLGIEGQEMPDLPVVATGGLRVFNEVTVDAGLGVFFDSAKIHRFLCDFQCAHRFSFEFVGAGSRSRRCCDGSPKVLATRLKNAKRAVMCVASAICNWFQPTSLSRLMSSAVTL